MRYKWSLQYYYPIYNGTEVAYTTCSKKMLFRHKFIAKLFHIILKAYCKLKGKYHWTMFSYIPKYSIDTDLGIDYADEGQWRSYQLASSGDTFDELIQDASVAEIDQDGGELDCYCLDHASNEIQDVTLKLFNNLTKGEAK